MVFLTIKCIYFLFRDDDEDDEESEAEESPVKVNSGTVLAPAEWICRRLSLTVDLFVTAQSKTSQTTNPCSERQERQSRHSSQAGNKSD